MKVTCNSVLEAPVINLIKLYDSLNVNGVCGILTPGSKHNLEHTTISALGLLSYCNELIVSKTFKEQLRMVDISLDKGPINYYNVANASQGILQVPEGVSEEPFAMATNPIRFKLLVGSSTCERPLTDVEVFTYVTGLNTKGYEFTAVPLPLLSKNIVKFNVTRDNGMSEITCLGVSDKIISELFSSLKVDISEN